MNQFDSGSFRLRFSHNRFFAHPYQFACFSLAKWYFLRQHGEMGLSTNFSLKWVDWDDVVCIFSLIIFYILILRREKIKTNLVWIWINLGLLYLWILRCTYWNKWLTITWKQVHALQFSYLSYQLHIDENLKLILWYGALFALEHI